MGTNRSILTASQVTAAEAAAIDAGTSVEVLMERAGAALAEGAYRFGAGMPTLILCGPGNNGGDGYVAARHLAGRGVKVRVAAVSDPASPGAQWARSKWEGPVEPIGPDTASESMVIDAIFGTGLKRPLELTVSTVLSRLVENARLSIACDLPSGVATDSGELLSTVPAFDMTVAFGALKPAHRLAPAMHRCGRVVVADIGIATVSDWFEIGSPDIPRLDPHAHKYSRGLVHALAGEMPGAIALAATAASRTGAGYVRISTSKPIGNLPAAVVQTDTAVVDDPRIGCLLVGPGMGKSRSF